MDRRAMEKIREFDKKVRQDREYAEWFYKVPMWFCEGMALFMICFVQSENIKKRVIDKLSITLNLLFYFTR